MPRTMPAAVEVELRRAGLRVTEGRVRVLTMLKQMPHSSATAVHAELGEDATSIQSVHNALAALTDAGLLRRIEPAGSPALYELHDGDNHHHLVCNRCRTIVDVECVVGHAPCLSPSDDASFAVSSAEVTFWGTCPACANLETTALSTATHDKKNTRTP